MSPNGRPTLFLLGNDYHLGDLLWLTPVLHEYRRQGRPSKVTVGCPDRDISRILENNPNIDELLYGKVDEIRRTVLRQFSSGLIIHDLRPQALAMEMLRDWRHRLPWMYYSDLWLQPRGQWLATFLHLGRLPSYLPSLVLKDDERFTHRVRSPYVVLAPRIGSYAVPGMGHLWRKVKGWENERWERLGECFLRSGLVPVTLAARDQEPVPGTEAIMGLPIREAASVIKGAELLISGESGLWFIGAAVGTPFGIVPWWLPKRVRWAEPMGVRHLLFRRGEATVEHVFTESMRMIGRDV